MVIFSRIRKDKEVCILNDKGIDNCLKFKGFLYWKG